MFYLNKKEARLIILQRIELISNYLKRVRKIFGRYIFTNFVSKYFLVPSIVGKAYFDRMNDEFESIKNILILKIKYF